MNPSAIDETFLGHLFADLHRLCLLGYSEVEYESGSGVDPFYTPSLYKEFVRRLSILGFQAEVTRSGARVVF